MDYAQNHLGQRQLKYKFSHGWNVARPPIFPLHLRAWRPKGPSDFEWMNKPT